MGLAGVVCGNAVVSPSYCVESKCRNRPDPSSANDPSQAGFRSSHGLDFVHCSSKQRLIRRVGTTTQAAVSNRTPDGDALPFRTREKSCIRAILRCSYSPSLPPAPENSGLIAPSNADFLPTRRGAVAWLSSRAPPRRARGAGQPVHGISR